MAERHLVTLKQPLTGWMGHAAPFEFTEEYCAGQGIEKLQCGTPPILSLSALNGALDAFDGVDMQAVRDKSNALKSLFKEIVLSSKIARETLTLITPEPLEKQGSQLSFTHQHAYPISQALIDAGVIVDFRAPNIVRFGFTPLYLSFADVYRAAQALVEIIQQRHYLVPEFNLRSKVT